MTSTSKPTSFPSKLRDKLSGDVQAVDESAKDNEQLANEACEKCGGNEVRFHTLQLRSADEGSTVFYTCHTCGHKYEHIGQEPLSEVMLIIVITGGTRTTSLRVRRHYARFNWSSSAFLMQLLRQS